MLPDRLRTRAGFAVTGAVLGGLYAAYVTRFGMIAADAQDHLPAAIGAISGGALAAAALWPRSNRRAGRMVFIGVLTLLAAIVSAHFCIGFFSEAEVESRAAGGIGAVFGSFVGAWLMGVVLAVFSLSGTFFLMLLPGGLAGWLFSDPRAV